jgi:hypothetical protein
VRLVRQRDDAGDARQPHLRMGSSSKHAPEAARKAHLYDLMARTEHTVPGSPRPYESRKDQPLPKVRSGTESQGPLMHFQAVPSNGRTETQPMGEHR